MSKPKTVVFPREYEYAGFRYMLTSPQLYQVVATPLPGQHPAANKEKHRHAAVASFLQENKPYD